MPTEGTLRAALHTVADPELVESIVELGLVKSIAIGEARVDVVLIPTSATCPKAELFIEDATSALRAVCPRAVRAGGGHVAAVGRPVTGAGGPRIAAALGHGAAQGVGARLARPCRAVPDGRPCVAAGGCAARAARRAVAGPAAIGRVARRTARLRARNGVRPRTHHAAGTAAPRRQPVRRSVCAGTDRRRTCAGHRTVRRRDGRSGPAQTVMMQSGRVPFVPLAVPVLTPPCGDLS
nr:iron-sulfur cluster assembly protein [Methyloversatilis sp. XJ19-49]